MPPRSARRRVGAPPARNPLLLSAVYLFLLLIAAACLPAARGTATVSVISIADYSQYGGLPGTYTNADTVLLVEADGAYDVAVVELLSQPGSGAADAMTHLGDSSSPTSATRILPPPPATLRLDATSADPTSRGTFTSLPNPFRSAATHNTSSEEHHAAPTSEGVPLVVGLSEGADGALFRISGATPCTEYRISVRDVSGAEPAGHRTGVFHIGGCLGIQGVTLFAAAAGFSAAACAAAAAVFCLWEKHTLQESTGCDPDASDGIGFAAFEGGVPGTPVSELPEALGEITGALGLQGGEIVSGLNEINQLAAGIGMPPLDLRNRLEAAGQLGEVEDLRRIAVATQKVREGDALSPSDVRDVLSALDGVGVPQIISAESEGSIKKHGGGNPSAPPDASGARGSIIVKDFSEDNIADGGDVVTGYSEHATPEVEVVQEHHIISPQKGIRRAPPEAEEGEGGGGVRVASLTILCAACAASLFASGALFLPPTIGHTGISSVALSGAPLPLALLPISALVAAALALPTSFLCACSAAPGIPSEAQRSPSGTARGSPAAAAAASTAGYLRLHTGGSSSSSGAAATPSHHHRMSNAPPIPCVGWEEAAGGGEQQQVEEAEVGMEADGEQVVDIEPGEAEEEEEGEGEGGGAAEARTTENRHPMGEGVGCSSQPEVDAVEEFDGGGGGGGAEEGGVGGNAPATATPTTPTLDVVEAYAEHSMPDPRGGPSRRDSLSARLRARLRQSEATGNPNRVWGGISAAAVAQQQHPLQGPGFAGIGGGLPRPSDMMRQQLPLMYPPQAGLGGFPGASQFGSPATAGLWSLAGGPTAAQQPHYPSFQPGAAAPSAASAAAAAREQEREILRQRMMDSTPSPAQALGGGGGGGGGGEGRGGSPPGQPQGEGGGEGEGAVLRAASETLQRDYASLQRELEEEREKSRQEMRRAEEEWGERYREKEAEAKVAADELREARDMAAAAAAAAAEEEERRRELAANPTPPGEDPTQATTPVGSACSTAPPMADDSADPGATADPPLCAASAASAASSVISLGSPEEAQQEEEDGVEVECLEEGAFDTLVVLLGATEDLPGGLLARLCGELCRTLPTLCEPFVTAIAAAEGTGHTPPPEEGGQTASECGTAAPPLPTVNLYLTLHARGAPDLALLRRLCGMEVVSAERRGAPEERASLLGSTPSYAWEDTAGEARGGGGAEGHPPGGLPGSVAGARRVSSIMLVVGEHRVGERAEQLSYLKLSVFAAAAIGEAAAALLLSGLHRDYPVLGGMAGAVLAGCTAAVFSSFSLGALLLHLLVAATTTVGLVISGEWGTAQAVPIGAMFFFALLGYSAAKARSALPGAACCALAVGFYDEWLVGGGIGPILGACYGMVAVSIAVAVVLSLRRAGSLWWPVLLLLLHSVMLDVLVQLYDSEGGVRAAYAHLPLWVGGAAAVRLRRTYTGSFIPEGIARRDMWWALSVATFGLLWASCHIYVGLRALTHLQGVGVVAGEAVVVYAALVWPAVFCLVPRCCASRGTSSLLAAVAAVADAMF